jgi:hypothetical protein
MQILMSLARRATLALALASTVHALQKPVSDPGIEFFENRVRPVLAENCYRCHSDRADKLKGGLRLDTREGLLKGGDSGPALVPGEPDKSLLIKAVRYTDESLQMPPKNKKLAPEQIAALEQWVKLGAPLPDDAALSASKVQQTRHWAFQRVRQPPLPSVVHTNWVQGPIDQFVLAKLEAKGLTPSPRVDKRTLIRRLTFDLTGLPPSPDDVQRFLSDDSPDAYAKVVERLLGSPEYGERWARHWLDVARYADTKGYVFEEERRYPYAYTYRDYVIRAFNEDLPFDQFIVQQIAADLLPGAQDKRALAALGYLTLGRRFLNNPHDIIDDRIDVVTRGMMGLTVACARCHDHKFDPITTRDYYSLYGVFASCSEPEEEPLLGSLALPPEYPEYLREHNRRREELDAFRTGKEAEVRSQLRQSIGEYLQAAYETAHLSDSSRGEALARERKLDPHIVQRWVHQLERWREGPLHPVFAPWFALADCGANDFAEAAEALRRSLESGCVGGAINPLVAAAFAQDPPACMREVSERYGQLFSELDRGWKDRTDPCFEQLRNILDAPDSPAVPPAAELTRLFDVPSIQKLRALKRKLEELDATHPGAPPRAMALTDNATPQNAHVLLRGNPANLGPEVPREFPVLLTGGREKPFQKGSGRLELAQAIASRDNPLTARVLVNRVWLHYFGVGLVRTPSDFGLRSEPPANPEILDYLAARFMDEGWSLKKLHRWIVLSSVYQQASDDVPQNARLDPGNTLFWRMNRRRLDFEATRDSLLAVSGQLERTAGGHSQDLLTQPFCKQRTVYGFIERQNLPGLFRTFDFASPDTTSPQRFSTTVPQQALFMINSPFVIEEAEALANRADIRGAPTPGERLRRLYELVYQRPPAEPELGLALQFIKERVQLTLFTPDPPAWQYGFGEYDRSSQFLREFHPLSRFTGDAWLAPDKAGDPQTGSLQLRATGGHPGNDHAHAAVRRWVAPRSLTLSISGLLRHDSAKGDGVQAWIVSSHNGELASWVVHQGKQKTNLEHLEVEPGEAIDFIVDCRSGPEADTFSWAPVISAKATEEDVRLGRSTEWNARDDFAGPQPASTPLDAWSRFAQVLLMSNEFVFLD